MFETFKVGDRVFLKSDPSRRGIVVEADELIAGVQLDGASEREFYCNPELSNYDLD